MLPVMLAEGLGPFLSHEAVVSLHHPSGSIMMEYDDTAMAEEQTVEDASGCAC